MNHLLRSHAPISDAGWALIDDEARTRLAAALAARKLVDFSGPHGWQHSATNLGRVTKVGSAPVKGVKGLQRQVLPLVELRADFIVKLDELRDHDRGRQDVDLEKLDEAAHAIAVAENTAVFHGWSGAGITGIAEASPHKGRSLPADPNAYPTGIAMAVELLLQSGIVGPYALVLGGEQYTNVIETTEHGGYPLLDHLRKILDGPVIWAPGMEGGIVASLRGGDFLFESGQDFAIGYDHADAESVHLYLEESLSFVVATPEAAVPLAP
ncbi:MAG TPA: family 1 encapsulin nanocompartment shell protein [Gaiellaceae bacterium]|jgi:uncharacterized linocin/CFP29 family protein|nr:family 1 encapsulin nanocompartment shell protein [Gaiellaceae bacterium]